MKLKLNFFFLLAAVVFVRLEISAQISPSGYKYQTLLNGKGPKPNAGDHAPIIVEIYLNDSLASSTRNYQGPLWLQVEDPMTWPDSQRQVGISIPYADLLLAMQVGDSIMIENPIDKWMKMAPEFQHVKRMHYIVVMQEIQTDKAYQAKREREQAIKDSIATELKANDSIISRELKTFLKQYKKGALDKKNQTTSTGLKYLIIEVGHGPKLHERQIVTFNYCLSLFDGKIVDSSYSRGEAVKIPLGRGMVIRGWEEGLLLLNVGSRAIFFIPPSLGYGDQDNQYVPANSELIYLVEIEKTEAQN